MRDTDNRSGRRSSSTAYYPAVPVGNGGSSNNYGNVSSTYPLKEQDEEWLTKKKVETTTRKLSERRLKRQVVLADGRVIEEDAPEVTVDTVLDHVEHMVGLVGPDHVGLGSDLDGGFKPSDAPQGIDSVADLRRIGEGLAARGLDDGAIGKILGGNWMRVLTRALPE